MFMVCVCHEVFVHVYGVCLSRGVCSVIPVHVYDVCFVMRCLYMFMVCVCHEVFVA